MPFLHRLFSGQNRGQNIPILLTLHGNYELTSLRGHGRQIYNGSPFPIFQDIGHTDLETGYSVSSFDAQKIVMTGYSLN